MEREGKTDRERGSVCVRARESGSVGKSARENTIGACSPCYCGSLEEGREGVRKSGLENV